MEKVIGVQNGSGEVKAVIRAIAPAFKRGQSASTKTLHWGENPGRFTIVSYVGLKNDPRDNGKRIPVYSTR